MRDTLLCMAAYDDAEKAFQDLFTKIASVFHEDQYVNVDSSKVVFLFRGGQDIHPSLYGEARITESQAPLLLSERDAFEVKAFNFAKQMNIPMLGVCRGSQFLCAMSGGKLVQHVTGHGCGSHNIIATDGKVYNATSTHHQMMYPWPTKHRLIAWSTPTLGTEYILNKTNTLKKLPVEPEIVFFNETKSLGIQGHPEYLTQAHPYTKYCNHLVKDYLL